MPVPNGPAARHQHVQRDEAPRPGLPRADGVELDIAETSIPVLQRKQLKNWIRNKFKELPQSLDDDTLYDIEQAMLGNKIDEL